MFPPKCANNVWCSPTIEFTSPFKVYFRRRTFFGSWKKFLTTLESTLNSFMPVAVSTWYKSIWIALIRLANRVAKKSQNISQPLSKTLNAFVTSQWMLLFARSKCPTIQQRALTASWAIHNEIPSTWCATFWKTLLAVLEPSFLFKFSHL